MTPQDNLEKLFTLVEQLIALPAINKLRYHAESSDVDKIACEIEATMAALDLFTEDSNGNTVLDISRFAASVLGSRGGSVSSEAKTAANRIKAKKPRKRTLNPNASSEALYRREYRKKKKSAESENNS